MEKAEADAQDYGGRAQGTDGLHIDEVVSGGVVEYAMIEEVAGFKEKLGAADGPAEAEIGEDQMPVTAGDSIVEIVFKGRFHPETLAQEEPSGKGLLKIGEAGELAAAGITRGFFHDAACDRGPTAAVKDLRPVG